MPDRIPPSRGSTKEALDQEAGGAHRRGDPRVAMHTSAGAAEIALYPRHAPRTVERFLENVASGFYDGLLFHRVIADFVIQGGGYEPGMHPRPPGGTIPNEADNGLRNVTGTLSMARSSDPHSATSQFFVNLRDNDFLDHTGRNLQGWGYAVFARIAEGFDTMLDIASRPTGIVNGFSDVPLEDILILRMERLDD